MTVAMPEVMPVQPNLVMEAQPAASVPLSQPVVQFNVDEAQEKLRGWIAQALVWLLVGEIMFFLLVALVNGLGTGGDPSHGAFGLKFADLKDLFTIVLTPTTALVGAATGFYYGGKSGRG